MDSFKLLGGGASAGTGGLMGEAGMSESVMGVAMAGSDIASNPCPCLKLTIKQRLMGFVSCFSLGILISFMSTIALTRNIQTFGARARARVFTLPACAAGSLTPHSTLRAPGVLYSMGNIMALMSTGFLVGASRALAPAASAPGHTTSHPVPLRCTAPSPARPRRPRLPMQEHVPLEAHRGDDHLPPDAHRHDHCRLHARF
jgi:hypothetical protein